MIILHIHDDAYLSRQFLKFYGIHFYCPFILCMEYFILSSQQRFRIHKFFKNGFVQVNNIGSFCKHHINKYITQSSNSRKIYLYIYRINLIFPLKSFLSKKIIFDFFLLFLSILNNWEFYRIRVMHMAIKNSPCRALSKVI